MKAGKEEWFDKRKKSKRKHFSLFFKKKGTIEPIVLEPQAKRFKVQKISKNSKALHDAKRIFLNIL